MTKEEAHQDEKKKKLTKEEKKEEKRRKKELKKSRESLDHLGDGSVTPKTKKKDKKLGNSPGRDSQYSTGSKKKGKGLFKRIGSFMLPAPALAPASPPAQEKVVGSRSCNDLSGPRIMASPTPTRSGHSTSASSPNLYDMPPNSPPPPVSSYNAHIKEKARQRNLSDPTSDTSYENTYSENPGTKHFSDEQDLILHHKGKSYKIPNYSHPTPELNRYFPARKKSEPNSFLDDNFDSIQSDYGSILVTLTNGPGNEVNCVIRNDHVTTSTPEPRDKEISCLVEEVAEEGAGSLLELEVEAVDVQQVTRNPVQQLGGDISVEYSIPYKNQEATPRSINPFSSDEDEDDVSPRTISYKAATPSPRKAKRISFAGDDETEFRIVTPEILKRDLTATIGVPSPPETMYNRDVIDLPELANMEDMSNEERFNVYEEKILQFRDQALKIVSENSRLKKMISEQNSQDIDMVHKQAQQVLQENRTLIKEQQMNEARWQELIEERNQEVLRMRATCSNMEDQNTTLLKRCEKLEARNEELREAYNNIVTQADDFVPVSAHLNSVEGYKVALEELRKRYDDNVHEREEEIEGLDKNVSQLTERLEVLEEEKSLLAGQVKGLKTALEKAQHSSTKHKREAAQLAQRVNTLKVSLAQAINIAEQSTLHKLELAEILQISDLQEKQKRTNSRLNTETKVKEVKKIANAKLKSCAEILQEREEEHQRSISRLNDRITKLKLRCENKDEIIHSLTNSDRTNSPEST